MTGNIEIRRKVEEWFQDEGTLVYMGVWNREALVADPAIAIHEQVQIHGSGLPADGASDAALIGLDHQQSVQQLMGLEPRLDGDNGIHVVGLFARPNRRIAVKRRDADEPGLRQFGQRIPGPAYLLQRLAEVAANTDVSGARRCRIDPRGRGHHVCA